jgi:hypothetical protein
MSVRMKFLRKPLAVLLVFLALFSTFTFLQFGFVPQVYAQTAFSAVNVTSVHTCPLDTHTFAVAYSDDTNDDFSFQVWDTNGTQVLAETDVDSTSGGGMLYTSIGISAFNSSVFALGWYDRTDYDATFAVYNTAGTLLSGPTDADTDIGVTSFSVQVSCFNSTHFVIAWIDSTEADATFAVYDSSSNLVAGPTDVDTGVSASFSVSVSALNSTVFVIGWNDYLTQDATFAVYNSAGTKLAGPTDADTDTGSANSVSVSAFDSATFVIAWFDGTDQDATFTIYNSAGTNLTLPIDVDAAVGTDSYSVQVAALNSTVFAVSWYDSVDFDLTFATYMYVASINNVTVVTVNTDIEGWPTSSNLPFLYQSPCSQETGTGIKIYSDNWVIAYANTTTQSIWRAFMPNGTAWDGLVPAAGDTTKPTYSGVSTNSTVWATSCNFSVTLADETALANYTFGCNNTGLWVNGSVTVISGSSYKANTTQTLNATNSNATSPEIIQWEYWFADSSNNLNNTGIQTLTLSYSLSVGWNNVTIFSFDVGYTLAGINASLNYDAINWTYIVYQNASATAEYPFVKNMSANNLIRVNHTAGILLIFCNTAGNWTHTYPYQGGDYGEDPTPYVVAAVSIGAIALTIGIIKKRRKLKSRKKAV